jgi:predicted DNA-binding transcriptional regulator AlpA
MLSGRQSGGALNEREAAEQYGMSVAWFRRGRWDGTGPRFYKIGRAVRYPRAELDRYFAARLRRSTSDDGGST